MQLRPYQDKMVQDARIAFATHRRVLIQCATGSGKTQIAANIAHTATAKGKTVYFCCHRQELVRSTCNTFAAWGIPHGVVMAQNDRDHHQPVLVCSVQTLQRRLDKLPCPDLLILDESQMAASDGIRNIVSAYAKAHILGLSATPTRLDGKPLDVFDAMVKGPSMRWLIDAGFLADYRYFSCPNLPDMNGVRKIAGDYNPAQAEAKMQRKEIVGDAVEHWRKYADGLSTLGFACTVKHAYDLAEAFKAAGIASEAMDGEMGKEERKAILGRFGRGETKVVWNQGLFDTGFDLQSLTGTDATVDAVILMRPTDSLTFHLQSIGRSLRPKVDGKKAVILDHAGNYMRHGMPCIEREWTLEGGKDANKTEEKATISPFTCPKCYGLSVRPCTHCAHCGFEIPVNERTVPMTKGELKEIEARQAEIEKVNFKRQRASCRSFQELVALAKSKRFKAPEAWARYIIQARETRGR